MLHHAFCTSMTVFGHGNEYNGTSAQTTFYDLHLGFKNLEGVAIANQRQGAGPSKNAFSASCTIYGH
jgi:hypothetical protein